jgi:hypothetical protein
MSEDWMEGRENVVWGLESRSVLGRERHFLLDFHSSFYYRFSHDNFNSFHRVTQFAFLAFFHSSSLYSLMPLIAFNSIKLKPYNFQQVHQKKVGAVIQAPQECRHQPEEM